MSKVTKKLLTIFIQKIPTRPTPPPPNNSECFEFQNYLKNAEPPLGSNSDIFNLRHIDGERPPQTDT